MAKHEASAERFKQDVQSAGFRVSTSTIECRLIADALNCSESHVRNMIAGHNRPGDALQERLNALMHLRESSERPNKAEHPAPLSPLNQAEPGPVLAPAEVDLAAPQPIPRKTKYQVIKVFDGYAVVENPIAVFRGLSWAEEYASWLNEQIKRGKESG